MIRLVLKLDTKCLTTGSELTLAEMSRVQNILYYGADRNVLLVKQNRTTKPVVTKSNMAVT